MKKLTDICDIQYGYAFDSKCFTEDSAYPPLVRIRDVKRGYSETYYSGEYPEEYVLSAGDLLVGMDGEFNIARWKCTGALLNQRVCKLVAKIGTNEEYLRFAMSKALKKIEQRTAFVTVKHLSAKELNKLELDVPELSNQDRIADILNRLENVIEKRREELDKLDELIKARFVEMFGDVIRNDRGWPVRKFSDITNSRLGKMLDAKQQTGTCMYPYLANYNVQWFRFELDTLNQMDFNDKDREEFALEDGDLLVCEGGEIGRCAVWHNQVENCYFQKALHRVRCNRDLILPDYLAWWFKYNCENGGFVAIEGAKATISHLTGAKMKDLDVAIPDIKDQCLFVEFIKQVNKSKVAVQKALDETKLLFDSLMQQYFG